jgi:hypothetical protein
VSGDNRQVATDALHTLGTIIDEHQKRDAIHLAVIPVVAGSEYLTPGMSIRVDNGVAYRCNNGAGQGIVDPFLPDLVKEGERFWCVIYPRTIKSLRHVWSHPSFPDEADTPAQEAPASEQERATEWIRKYAEDLGLTYDELMEGAAIYLTEGDYLVKGGLLEGEYVGNDFWDKYEIVVGRSISDDDRGSFFSCSC